MIHQPYFVSVNEAIRKGRFNLRTIPTVLALGGLAIYIVLFLDVFGPRNIARQFNPALLFLIPVGSLIIAFIWRNFHSVAWKIWALENVQDVHRLYQVALSKGMIYKRDSWMNKLEFKTADQRLQLASLEARLDQPRQLEQPASFATGEAREFGYSLKKMALQLTLFLPVIIVFYFIMGKFEFFPIGIFAAILGGIMLFQWVPRIGKPAPIRFNDTSLTIKENPPIAWRNITNIYIDKRSQGKSSVAVLVVERNTSPHQVELEVDSIEGGAEDIEPVLYDYWVRGMKQLPEQRL